GARPGGPTRPELMSDAAPVAAREGERGGARKRALVVGGKRSRLSFYLQVPETGRLAMSFGAPAAAADVAVRVAVDGQPTRTVWEAHAARGWVDTAVDLGTAAGHAA